MRATLDLPEELGLALDLTSEALVAEVRMAAAAKLFELGRLSAGRAAELANVPRVRFLHELARFGVPSFAPRSSYVEDDIAAARPGNIPSVSRSSSDPGER